MEQKDSYEGPFPVIELEGTPFYANGYLIALVEVSKPENQIGILDMMSLEDHIELWYDSDSKNVYKGPHYGEIPDRVTLLGYIRSLRSTPWEKQMDGQKPSRLAQRFPGGLAVIQIASKEFFIDERRNAFRDTENFWNLIHFADVLKQDGKTGIYIDKRVAQLPFPHQFDNYAPPLVLPEHIVFASVPDGHQLAAILNEQKLHQTSDEPQDERRRIGR